jgi:hypothetical protein
MLPLEWVDKLFQKLAVVYGSEFLRKYQGIDAAAIKQEWATELGVFAHRPDAIRFALAHLPSDKCPSMLQFRDLCRQAPRPNTTALPEPKPSVQVVDKEIAKMVEKAFTNRDPKLWAKKLKKRHEAGEKLTMIQVKAYKEALDDAYA